jgi:uncharacterized protein (DUF1501 family)
MSDTTAIRAELSTPPDTSPEGISRRRFLQCTAAGVASVGVGLALSGHAGAAFGAPLAPGEGVLVLVQLSGGNDGLNTVAPVDDGRYRSLRRNLALDPSTALRIDGGLALHPSLPTVKRLYDQGDVAIVQGVGYGNSSLSHFDSMALWMDGSAGARPGSRSQTGWIGRHLDAKGRSRSELEAVAFDTGVPLTLSGREAQAVALSAAAQSDFGVKTSANLRRVYAGFDQMAAGSSSLGTWGDRLADNVPDAIAKAREVAPVYAGDLSGGSFTVAMGRAARLVNADVGVRVISLETGGFDTHDSHEWQHAQALARLDSGLAQFFADLDPKFASRVVVVTFSEFGRRAETNGSSGTDHGAASVSFVVGQRVKGGLHGAYPSLGALDSRGNLVPQVDFRSLYATLLDRWLASDSSEVLGGRFENLDLFGADPDGRTVVGPAPAPLAKHGYLLGTSTGGIHNFGKFANFGSPWVNNTVAVRRNPVADGYWAAGSDGGVFSFGTAGYHGSMGGRALSAPVVDMAVAPDGKGYWLLGRDGGVFAFGSARFFGSTGSLRLSAPVVAMAAHPGGGGYWFCAADGGVFSYGRSQFHGSTGGIRINRPIVGMAAHPSGDGYWLAADDGGVFAFGDATFQGSLGGVSQSGVVVSMAS